MGKTDRASRELAIYGVSAATPLYQEEMTHPLGRCNSCRLTDTPSGLWASSGELLAGPCGVRPRRSRCSFSTRRWQKRRGPEAVVSP